MRTVLLYGEKDIKQGLRASQYIFNVKNIQNDSWVYALLYNIIKDSKSTNPIVWTLGHSAYIIAL